MGNEETFANTFLKGAHIWAREYNLIIPRVPLTFNPKKDTDLREIKEVNGLTSHIIHKARWIKLAEHRRPGQMHAYMVLTVMSVDIANKLIRDGIGICSSFSRLSKQKQELIQYMKCRRWGHFADKCPESEDTCSTCGGKHCTSACKAESKLYCVLCVDSTHTSWDRSCLEFIRQCENINCYSSFDLSSIYTVKYHLMIRICLYQLSFLISMIPGLHSHSWTYPLSRYLAVIT